MNKVELNEMVGGVLNEKFNNSLKRVLDNLQDVNTPYKDKREIVIKMTFVQNEARDDVGMDIKITEKLAPQVPMSTRFAVAKDLRSGEVHAEEYGKQLRGQVSMDEATAAPVAAVNLETGEIMGNGVVDFRKAQGK